MKLKHQKLSPIKIARLKREIRELEEEIAIMPQVSALRDITDELRGGLKKMAETAGLPVELFAPNYASFQAVNLRMRIALLEAQLAGDRLH